jgi:hypothetical protein
MVQEVSEQYTRNNIKTTMNTPLRRILMFTLILALLGVIGYLGAQSIGLFSDPNESQLEEVSQQTGVGVIDVQYPEYAEGYEYSVFFTSIENPENTGRLWIHAQESKMKAVVNIVFRDSEGPLNLVAQKEGENVVLGELQFINGQWVWEGVLEEDPSSYDRMLVQVSQGEQRKILMDAYIPQDGE